MKITVSSTEGTLGRIFLWNWIFTFVRSRCAVLEMPRCVYALMWVLLFLLDSEINVFQDLLTFGGIKSASLLSRVKCKNEFVKILKGIELLQTSTTYYFLLIINTILLKRMLNCAELACSVYCCKFHSTDNRVFVMADQTVCVCRLCSNQALLWIIPKLKI